MLQKIQNNKDLNYRSMFPQNVEKQKKPSLRQLFSNKAPSVKNLPKKNKEIKIKKEQPVWHDHHNRHQEEYFIANFHKSQEQKIHTLQTFSISSIDNNNAPNQQEQSQHSNNSMKILEKIAIIQDQKLKQKSEQNLIEKQKPKKLRSKIFNKEQIQSFSKEKIETCTEKWAYGDGFTPNFLFISSWNVNGIRSIMSKKSLPSYLNRKKPDIICLNQTKTDKLSFFKSPIQISGYNTYWNFPKFAVGYSGVAIFSKYKPISSREDLFEEQNQFNVEGRVLMLQFQKFIIITPYMPMSGKQLERLNHRQSYDKAFKRYINKLKKQHSQKCIIIAGDLNVAHTELDIHLNKTGKDVSLTPSFTQRQRSGLNDLLSIGLTDVYRMLNPTTRAYTWWFVKTGGRDRINSPGIGKRIDYFLVSNEFKECVQSATILREQHGSDHAPIQMTINFEKKKKAEEKEINKQDQKNQKEIKNQKEK